ncbi:DUF6412 domain-containing protein [Pseudonocardia nematodicida]|uniref:DUF6412 domain-containing protein n=1 Tax=Pseudonocardia nematodicida TaxID=1206997 RepID=A0ABV1K4R2_9PSEU
MTDRTPALVRGAAAMVLATLLVLVPVLFTPDGDAGLLGAVVALALLACAGRGAGAQVRAIVTTATTVRERHRAGRTLGVPRHSDPDAPGRPRPRAPGALRPEPATA